MSNRSISARSGAVGSALCLAAGLGASAMIASPAGASSDTQKGNCHITTYPSVALNGSTLSTEAIGYCNTACNMYDTLYIQHRAHGSTGAWTAITPAAGGQYCSTQSDVLTFSNACVSGNNDYEAVTSFWHDTNNAETFVSNVANFNCK